MAVLKIARGLVAASVVTICLAATGPARPPLLAAMARIEPGLWQIKTLGSDAPPRAICVADPVVLVHFDRPGAVCQHVVLSDAPDVGTVQYHCPGSGNGRTTFRVATPRAFDLETQGIAGGAPYEEHYEAHRLGNCAGAPPAR